MARFAGGGETGRLLRETDWSKTALGPTETWPHALQTLVRMVLHSRQPMLLWWGPELIQVYNDAFLPSFGKGKHPAAMGQPARESWSEVWPIVGSQLEAVMSRGEAIWKEDVLVPVFRNGHIDDAWWTYSYSPAFDDHGERAGIMIVCTETTRGVQARNQLEQARLSADLAREELHAAFMQAPLPIAILTGPEQTFALANPAYETLVSRPVLGKTMAQAFSEDEVGYYRPILDRVYRTGEPEVIREAELRLLNAAGAVEDRYIDVAYHPYHTADMTPVGVIAVINDVTPSVNARKLLERQQDERAMVLAREQELRLAAEAGGRARDEFLAMLSHELRNPLAPIATAMGLMHLRGDHHPKEREIVERQVAHLSRLVDDLLDVSRAASGKIELRRAPVDLAAMVTQAVETVSPLLEERLHELVVDMPSGLLFVNGDRVRLTQIVGNLLANAARYTPVHGKLEVVAARVGDEVVLRVRDNGPGIDEGLLPRVFDLFVQGPQRRDRAQGGLGLGLALVRNLVNLHGGTVAACNRASGGAEVTVRLPAEAVPLVTDEWTAIGDGLAVVAGAPARRVLVVDDNADAADMLSEMLQATGHEVRVAYDGPQALSALQAFPADVGLIDLGLPGMDGLELARRIRSQPIGDSLRLIALTGYGQSHDRDDTRAAGFDRHLTKPATVEDILAAIGVGES